MGEGEKKPTNLYHPEVMVETEFKFHSFLGKAASF